MLEPGRAERNYWRDLWRYRELFHVLAARDIAVRYKQTAIGVVWAVLRPFLTMVIFTVIFSRLAKLPSDGDAPYALMVLAGHAALDIFLDGAGRRLQQPDRQRESDQQSLFSTTNHSDGRPSSFPSLI